MFFRTAGTKIASDGLKGRVYEVSLADLQNENDAERSFRKFRLICEDVQVYILFHCREGNLICMMTFSTFGDS